MTQRPTHGPEWPTHRKRARLRRQGRSKFRLTQQHEQKENQK